MGKYISIGILGYKNKPFSPGFCRLMQCLGIEIYIVHPLITEKA